MKDESPIDAVNRVLKTQFGITPDAVQAMMLIDAVRDALPPPSDMTIASLRAILRTMTPHEALDAWADRCSREITQYLTRLALVHKIAVAVDDERMWCSIEGILSGMLKRVAQGKDLEPGPVPEKLSAPEGVREKLHKARKAILDYKSTGSLELFRANTAASLTEIIDLFAAHMPKPKTK